MALDRPAIVGATNDTRVKVKNRATLPATNVTVKGFHSLPGARLAWPTDFRPARPLARYPNRRIGRE
jgi:hypothetical protein